MESVGKQDEAKMVTEGVVRAAVTKRLKNNKDAYMRSELSILKMMLSGS
jgi:hypothetical protein